MLHIIFLESPRHVLHDEFILACLGLFMNVMVSCILDVKDAQEHFKSLNSVYLNFRDKQANVLIWLKQRPTAFIYTDALVC